MYDRIIDKNNPNSALKVQDAIGDKPSSVNTRFKLKKKREISVDEYVNGILNSDRVMLSQAITLVESNLSEHQHKAQQIIERCLPYAGKSIRVGITGVPGVGKSTTIEALGTKLTHSGHKLAVLAIDPTSEKTKGSILGDKTRMEELANDPNAFIRPSPSAGSLGGVARKTREIIILCEAAGFDVVFVETVGVGQSEVVAHSMVDFFLLLQLANAGDELQGIKRGIMEMADAISINKAELDPNRAELAASQYRSALSLFPHNENGWKPVVFTSSAYTGDGIDKIWETIMEYVAQTKANGHFHKKRNEQNLRILSETINSTLTERFYNSQFIVEKLEQFKQDVLNDRVSAYIAAQELIDGYFDNIEK
ncbi:MAG: methylmalonyl Co-A mutase-associated GTPase MeaB [Bacteroidales bacterium]|jgi:LAO/AO transport system kinase|nr:methylmalonyl Co-A mutase-associated GTPase MeaB [Bacteroidales bacterium]MBO7181098.1 methylmalonyl Co-A mutase-associated GTPase MeaB [Bacteroidales bacterium]MBQ2303468.1 methylmalonyl Co-A mutase-associated GTPase MeaB [Bacteroidales bacterium]MBQ2386840.1 methylmalonyl Co-A mutase-associated GTPase MeaB [Bacteroidales bacterium]MEE0917365.1 methylmalonyl Co-A mutase-associated GTPase MeaB [Bacteroidales bacterium]